MDYIKVQENKKKVVVLKREIRPFHVVVVQRRRLGNEQKSVRYVQSCCFANINLLLFGRSRCRRRCLTSLIQCKYTILLFLQ